MEIPLSSAIALNRIETQASDRREQQEMKKLVLDYEMREEQNEKKGSSLISSSLPRVFCFVGRKLMTLCASAASLDGETRDQTSVQGSSSLGSHSTAGSAWQTDLRLDTDISDR